MQVFSENIQLNELIMDYSASSSSHHNHEKYNENLGIALKKTMSLIQVKQNDFRKALLREEYFMLSFRSFAFGEQ
jgi:hypothetical protein